MTSVCIRVKNLRKIGYSDLENWMKNPKNIYVGRRGRIFIHEKSSKKIYHYKDNKWRNPYPVGKGPNNYSLKESLNLYIKHLFESGLILDIDELRGHNLGCFCDQSGSDIDCHAKVLSKLAGECYYVIESYIQKHS